MFNDNLLFIFDNRDQKDDPDLLPPLRLAKIRENAIEFHVLLYGKHKELSQPPWLPKQPWPYRTFVVQPSERATNIAAWGELANAGSLDQLISAVEDWKYELLVRDMRDSVPEIAHGEGFTGQAEALMTYKPVYEYQNGKRQLVDLDGSMSQLDRMIVEDCFNGSGHVQRPSEAIPTKSKWFRQEYLMRIIKCSAQEADILIECWRTLEFTPAMVSKTLAQINSMPSIDWVAYWTKWAYAAAEVETPPACSIDAPYETYTRKRNAQGEIVEKFTLNTFPKRTAFSSDDQGIRGSDWELDPDALTTSRDHHGQPLYSNLDAYSLYCDRNINPPIDDRAYASDAEFAYVTINNDLGEDRWMRYQPQWLHRAIWAIKHCKNQQQLADIAKFAWNDKRVQNAKPRTRQVFWGWYKAKRHEFRRQEMASGNADVTRVILRRIRKAEQKDVPSIGKWLYDLAQGSYQVPGFKPTKSALQILWKAYFKRKANVPV